MVLLALVVLAGQARADSRMYDDPRPVPEWRGVAPGTDYLGPDVLWRPREWLIFHMHDEEGTGFDLEFTVRDMNTYMQGPRRAVFWVLGPEGETLHLDVMEDDGVVAGNEQYRDGIYDVFQDYRYREWHRVFSPNGYPPGKQRSPYLANPERLPYRTASATVPPAGPGLYRVVIIASWDHWISMTPSRPMATGIHPGPGPLHVERGRFDAAYLYVPPQVEELGVSMAEETQPYNWRVRLETLEGIRLQETRPRTFVNYFVHTPGAEQKDAILRLRLSGESTGAHLHVVGVPFVLCPDPETARRIRGGLHIDDRGRQTFHAHQRVLNAWADGLTPADLHVEPVEADLAAVEDASQREWLVQLPGLLADQDLDPDSPDFGVFSERTAPLTLARIAGWDHPANPYLANPALIRRALLGVWPRMRILSPYLWYDRGYDFPRTFPVSEHALSSIALRSNWHNSMGLDSLAVSGPALAMKDVMGGALPEVVIAAVRRSLDLRDGGRLNMHSAEIVNQWLYSMSAALETWEFTENPRTIDRVRRQLRDIMTPGLMGRLNPDPTPYRSALGYGRPADSGRTGAGYLSEAYGYDIVYGAWCQESNLQKILRHVDEPLVEDYLEGYNLLRDHISLPRDGRHTVSRWTGIAAPNDFSSRTEGQPLMGAFARDMTDRTWPALEEDPFVRVLDHAFFFIQTGDYYGISYGGPAVPDWMYFLHAEVGDGSAALVGYRDFGRGGRGRKSTKAGGLSAVFVPNCGPTLMGYNHDVMYAHTLWGRLREPAFLAGGLVDPTIVSAGHVDPAIDFDREGRILRRSGTLTHAPLHFTRTLHFRDDRIEVELAVLALQDIEMAELREAIPFMVDDRTVRLFDDRLAPHAAFAAGDLPDGREAEAGVLTEIPAFRAFELTGPGGAGVTVILDGVYAAVMSAPFRPRAEAVFVRSFNLSLPTSFRAGQEIRLRYTIVAHQAPLPHETLMRQTEILSATAGER